VVGATLKIHYIGNNQNNAGEIVVKKFDPIDIKTNNMATDEYGGDETHTRGGADGPTGDGNERYLGSIPTRLDSACKATKFLPAKDGVSISFFKSQHAGFISHKELGDSTDKRGDGYLNSMRSLEGAVIWITGCNFGTGGEAGSSLNQSWRWELVQTIEVQPKPKTLLARLARPAPLDNPAVQAIISGMSKNCQDMGADISGSHHHPSMRQQCYSMCKQNAPKIAKSIGSSLPSVNY
jgi:hypothetical protein